LEGRVSGYGGASAGGGGGGALSRSENLIYNAGLDNWTDAAHPSNWQSASQSNWNTGTNVNREATILFALPYSARLGDNANAGKGMAQAAAFRVTPGQTYAVAARILAASLGAQYIILLKAYDSNAAEITTGTPLGSSWTYDASYGGWKITGTPSSTVFDLVQATAFLSSTVCWLRCSIQYYAGGETRKYIYVDEVKLSRGQTTEPWALRPVFDTEGMGSGTPNVLTKWAASGLALTDSHFTDDGTFTDLTYGANVTRLTLTAFGPAHYPSFTGRGARGTPSSPTPTEGGDAIASFSGRGYSASGFSTARAEIDFWAAQTWTDAVQGTLITFNTTPIGSTTLTERMRLSEGLIGFPPYPTILYSWPSAWPAGNYLLQCSTLGVLTWVPPSGGISGSGTQYRLAEWTGTSSLGNSSTIYRDTSLTGTPYRATTCYWRFDKRPLMLYNEASSSVPSPTPSLYYVSLYHKSTTYKYSNERLMFMGSDGVDRTVPNINGQVAWPYGSFPRYNMMAVWLKETDYLASTTSTTLGGCSSLTMDDATMKVYYNGVELNTGGGGGVGGSGTASYLPKWTAATTLGNSPAYVSGSYLVAPYFQASSAAILVGSTWPSGLGSSGQVLATNGAGTLYWVTAGGGGGVTFVPSGANVGYITVIASVSGTGGTIQNAPLVVDGSTGIVVYGYSGIYPVSDNYLTCGKSGARWSNIWAVATHFGDIGLSDTKCTDCGQAFVRGDAVGFHVKTVKRGEIVIVPKHISCPHGLHGKVVRLRARKDR
jgi:hypothetical protein